MNGSISDEWGDKVVLPDISERLGETYARALNVINDTDNYMDYEKKSGILCNETKKSDHNIHIW